MTPAFVLDCSAALPWIFEDEVTKATDRLLDDLAAGAEAWVPALWHLELGNVLLGAQKRGRIDQAGIEGFLNTLGTYRITIDDETMSKAWNKTLDLAAQHRLSTYDAAYLELALRRHLPLATLDAALVAAATAAGVSLCLPAE
jgi:predicted nucleic acid-binding protein